MAFAGGGYDTAIQVGAIHAFLASNAQPPDIVAGISGGACNAASLAEILQAGSDSDAGPRVARFREIVEGWLDSPAETLAGLVPDPYEVSARAPLKPQELPIHFKEERAERTRAVNARFGVIRLFNELLSIRLQLRTITQIVRLTLEVKRAGECRNAAKRWLWKLYAGFQLWALLGTQLALLAGPIGRIGWAMLWANRYQALLRLLEQVGALRCASRIKQLWTELKTGCLKLVLRVAGSYREKSAKGMILRSKLAWGSAVSLEWLLGFLVGALLWLVFPVIGVVALVIAELNRNKPDRPRPPGKGLGAWLLSRFLASFDLKRDIATPYMLKPQLVRLFDRKYYGDVNLGRVVDEALREHGGGIGSSSEDEPKRKKLSHYCGFGKDSRQNIYVAPIAANVSTGRLEVLPQDMSVVDALLAATAVVPLFRAYRLKGEQRPLSPGGGGGRETSGEKLLIDGMNVANEPTYGLLKHLIDIHREAIPSVRIRPDIAGVEIYPLSPFSVSEGKLDVAESGEKVAEYSELVSTVLRARQLQQFQDANLERKLARLYYKALPPGSTFVDIDGHSFVRARLRPIETGRVLDLNAHMFTAHTRTERRQKLAEGIAAGCRAMMQVILGKSLQDWAQKNSMPSGLAPTEAPCLQVLRWRNNALPPGSRPEHEARIDEICKHCALRKGSGLASASQMLEVPSQPAEDWPVRSAPLPPYKESKDEPGYSKTDNLLPAEGWPMARNGLPGDERPTITLLFSGGVFRGVFQVGVVNALSQAGLQPDLVAGSSVGSITAALISEVFNTAPPERPARIAELAAVFLGIDRLVLTDRFSDFVRRLTLRASEARFSLRDADEFFRRYDLHAFSRFNRRSRRVVAGLERLFYLTPFGLKDLVRSMRSRDNTETLRLVRLHLQYFLDRCGAGQEILGAEPLLLLIREFIHCPDLDSAALDLFSRTSGIHMLATTTNLMKGELKMLSSLPRATERERAILKEALLASSAFPGVFRPRWAWEVFPKAEAEQFVDGGVMDNLPLDGVAQFLKSAASKNWIKRQPQVPGDGETIDVPHLIFTASLEVRRRTLAGQEELDNLAESWPALAKRAKQLRYNQKVDKFARAQQHIRLIYEWRKEQKEEGADPGFDPEAWPLLNLETIVVKPEWLPSTFGFNSMLGFRRVNQAASIAHGCASTLVELHRRIKQHPKWAKAWGIHDQVDPACVGVDDQHPIQHGPNECWFRRCACPFAPESLKPLGLPDATCRELEAIYVQCGNRLTHCPPA